MLIFKYLTESFKDTGKNRNNVFYVATLGLFKTIFLINPKQRIKTPTYASLRKCTTPLR